MNNNLPLISICIPVLNEEQSIPLLYERLLFVTENNEIKSKYNFEFVFTDNASTDNTWKILQDLAQKDNRIIAFRFSKNVGYQNSILHNYLNCRGDAAIQLDADLQDPPEIIKEFLEHWEKGYQVVYGIREKRQEGFIKNVILYL